MGTLQVIATPIGNLEDLTLRAVRVLGELEYLACEDTRKTGTLLTRHGITPPPRLLAYHEHNKTAMASRIASLVAAGHATGIVSNAGYPSISDPGYRLIQTVIDQGDSVTVVPGASAVTSALCISGLPTAGYTFRGFAPKKSGPRKTFLAVDRLQPHTLVLFESPFRLGALLADALEVLGDRRAAVCVELTKLYERVDRGWLSDLADRYAQKKIKGEICVVIAPCHPKFMRSRPGTDSQNENWRVSI